MSDNLPEAPHGEFILFRSDDGQTHVECRFESDTLWLSQAEIANLYQVTPQAITQHVKVIYDEGELVQNSTCKSFLQVRQEGNRQVNRNILHYNLSEVFLVLERGNIKI
ncbi:DNA-binding protein [Photorhabdus luminescens]|uniref:DNA-binding protein n=1 Tax=Photorhabdus laumondii subsp. clarkei TaxID=2029685 RepID=A0A329VFH5_9GAMM|nr:DNA-binding protein [Photorhabdus luminescens]RAW90452.1 DNA-binding protein [Photorhabdus laumondii subsp. clarkei]